MIRGITGAVHNKACLGGFDSSNSRYHVKRLYNNIPTALFFFSGTSLPASSPDFMNGDSNFWVLVPKTAIVVDPLMEIFFLHLTDACEMMIRITKLGPPPQDRPLLFCQHFFFLHCFCLKTSPQVKDVKN